MQIKLIKIGKTPIDFDIKSDKITFKGFLQYHSGKLISLKAKLSGPLLVDCSSCAAEFVKDLDEDVEFFISDGLYKDESGVLVDVVESFDSTADIDALLNSEIELIKSDYNTCPECEV